MMTVFAVEWCPCRYESAHAIESLHLTKRGAYYALRKLLMERWNNEATGWKGAHRRQYYVPLSDQMWRIRAVEVQE